MRKSPEEDLNVRADITEWGINLQNKTLYKILYWYTGSTTNCCVWEEEDKEKEKVIYSFDVITSLAALE